MLMDESWYEIENNVWCTCENKCNFQANENNLPQCRQHKILMKISNNIEYLPREISQTQHGKKRNSVVDEFLENLETMNTSRRRSSSKLLPGFVPVDEITPSLFTRIPGLEVYLPACFSPTKLVQLESILDQDHFEFTEKNNLFNFSSKANKFAKRQEDNQENKNDEYNYEPIIESKNKITSRTLSDLTAGTVNYEKQSMEIRTDHNWDVFANGDYVENIQNSVSNMKITNLENDSTYSNALNLETKNADSGYDGMYGKKVLNTMTMKHEDDMQKTTKKPPECLFEEIESNMFTTQHNYTERLERKARNELCPGFPKDESNNFFTTQSDLATPLRRNNQNESCSPSIKSENDKMFTIARRNFTERLRRSTMNEKFSNLQASIPNIADKKVSKIDVIKSAIVYIKTLKQEERFYLEIIAEEKQKNKQLLMKLNKTLTVIDTKN